MAGDNQFLAGSPFAERVRFQCRRGKAVTNVTLGKTLPQMPFDLEQGIYLQAEAALLTGLPKTTVRRWLQLERGEGTINAISEQPLVSFLDLISLRAVAALRASGL